MKKGDAVRLLESIDAMRSIFDERIVKQLGFALGQDMGEYFDAVTGALEHLEIGIKNRVTQTLEVASCATCTKSEALPGKGRTCTASRMCVEFNEWVPLASK